MHLQAAHECRSSAIEGMAGTSKLVGKPDAEVQEQRRGCAHSFRLVVVTTVIHAQLLSNMMTSDFDEEAAGS